MTREEAIERCLIRETASYTRILINDLNDDGGETCFGISRRFNPGWTGWDLVDQMSEEDFKRPAPRDILKARAAVFYQVNYWDHFHCGDLPAEIAAEVFDFAVTSWDDAAKVLQRLVGAKPDGVIGPKTLTAVARSNNPYLLAVAYRGERARYYFGEAKRDKKDMRYLKGWLNRAWEV